MLRSLFVCLCMLFAGLPAAAQDVPPRSPQLLFQDNGTPRPILIESLSTHVQIRGLLAETTLTMTFRNPHGRVLEGELALPLPEGATVSGYGLDVEGQLVEGVIVEKTRARVAFETEVRKGVDPGLVEWTRGNSFRTRVYPIPAKGTRTVQVRYVSEIDGGSSQAVYVLPMAFEHAIPNFDLKVEVVRGTHRPTVLGGLEALQFEQWEERWVAETTRTDILLRDDLRIALPTLPDQLISIETDRSDAFFLIHDSPPAMSELALSHPEHIALFWDASLSRDAEDKTQELEILRALINRWTDIEIDLYTIRDTVDYQESFSIQKGDSETLFSILDQMVYDGGTGLSTVRAEEERPIPDLTLLFSDGQRNIGHSLPDTSQAPVYTVTGRSDANHVFLRYLSSSSGGEHINLGRREVIEAASKIGDGRLRFMGVEVESGELADVYPTGQAPVDGRFEISGRLLSDQATVIVQYGRAGEVLHRVRVQLRKDEASTSTMVSRFWAQQRVAELAVFPERNKDELLRLGRRHGLVTPNTSFLVLENLQQHLEHDVEPPVSRPEMREAWHAQKAVIAQQKEQTSQDHLDEVVRLWEAKVAWWESDFSDWEGRLKQSRDKDARSDRRRDRQGSIAEAYAEEDSMEMEYETGAPSRSQSEEARSPSPEAKKESARGHLATVTVTAWDPKTPYMAIIKAAHAKDRAYESYLEQRIGYGGSPAFYLDVATWFYAQDDTLHGRRVLSSILDLDLDQPALLRIVAQRLLEADDFNLAISIFEDVLEMRPEEPQSYRDLALALARRGEYRSNRFQTRPSKFALADLERSMELLHHVIMNRWDRFAEIEMIALVELNRLWAMADSMDAQSRRFLSRPDLDPRLIQNLDVDLRISLVWDADMTDIDLWVTEPTGEKAYYSNPLSAIGGKVSRDFTRGYGPEEYALRELIPGSYQIEANYYGSSQQTLVGPATVKAIVFTNYARPNETRQEITLRLDNVKQSFLVATVELDPGSL